MDKLVCFLNEEQKTEIKTIFITFVDETMYDKRRKVGYKCDKVEFSNGFVHLYRHEYLYMSINGSTILEIDFNQHNMEK